MHQGSHQASKTEWPIRWISCISGTGWSGKICCKTAATGFSKCLVSAALAFNLGKGVQSIIFILSWFNPLAALALAGLLYLHCKLFSGESGKILGFTACLSSRTTSPSHSCKKSTPHPDGIVWHDAVVVRFWCSLPLRGLPCCLLTST